MCRFVGVKALCAVFVTALKCCFRLTVLRSCVLSVRPSYTGLTFISVHRESTTHATTDLLDAANLIETFSAVTLLG